MNRTRSTVVLSFVVLLAALLTLSGPVSAGLLSRPLFQSGGSPQVVSYQGQVTVNGIAYTGTGYFKFAVVDQAGTTTTWSNDSTSTAGSEPTAAVTLTVTNGLFNVLLGNTSLANMTVLPASAFSEPNRYLRVWFSADGSTFTLLSPDRRIAAVPYAMQAEEAKSAATAGDADTLDGYHASDLLGDGGWTLTGNAGTTPGTNYLGTSDNQALEIKVNNVRVLRLEPGTSPNLIGGYSGNWMAAGTFGAVIAGGGQSGNLNRVVDHMGVVGGGQNNQAGSDDGTVGNNTFATVAGGGGNTASGTYSAIAGGRSNVASADAPCFCRWRLRQPGQRAELRL